MLSRRAHGDSAAKDHGPGGRRGRGKESTGCRGLLKSATVFALLLVAVLLGLHAISPENSIISRFVLKNDDLTDDEVRSPIVKELLDEIHSTDLEAKSDAEELAVLDEALAAANAADAAAGAGTDKQETDKPDEKSGTDLLPEQKADNEQPEDQGADEDAVRDAETQGTNGASEGDAAKGEGVAAKDDATASEAAATGDAAAEADGAAAKSDAADSEGSTTDDAAAESEGAKAAQGAAAEAEGAHDGAAAEETEPKDAGVGATEAEGKTGNDAGDTKEGAAEGSESAEEAEGAGKGNAADDVTNTDEKKAAGGLDKSASDSDAHEDEAEDEDDPESDADAYENDADEDFMDDAVKPWSSWTTTFQGLLDTARWRKDVRGDLDNPLLGEDSASFTGESAGDEEDGAVDDKVAFGDNHVHPEYHKHQKALPKHDRDEPDAEVKSNIEEEEAEAEALHREHHQEDEDGNLVTSPDP